MRLSSVSDKQPLAIPEEGYGQCAFGPDGRELATLGNRQLTVWNYGTGEERAKVPVKGDSRTVAWSPDGQMLASASGKDITIRSVASLQEIATLRQPKGYFLDLAFHPSGRFLATAAKDGFVRLWDAETWAELRSYAWRIGGVRCLAFSPDGTLAACAGDKGKIVVWDVDD
jgi:WD40 repeat protein